MIHMHAFETIARNMLIFKVLNLILFSKLYLCQMAVSLDETGIVTHNKYGLQNTFKIQLQ